jgi:hypothetical protein
MIIINIEVIDGEPATRSKEEKKSKSVEAGKEKKMEKKN